MEKLLFQVEDQLFCFELEYVLMVEQFEKVKDELGDIKVIDLKKIYSSIDKPSGKEVIFIGVEGNIVGVLVDKILSVIKAVEISPYKNENFMVEYTKGEIKISNFEVCYLLDAKKILEVAYEK